MTDVKLNVPERVIFIHDNLEVLRGINSGSVDLIYLDPPFNTKKSFTAPIGSSAEGASFKDIFYAEDIKDEWLETIKLENTPLYNFLLHTKTDGIAHNYAYLSYMAVRLIECQRLLKPTGSIYLHCDSTMSHYLKVVLDTVFGEGNFSRELIWNLRGAAGYKSLVNNYVRGHDTILFYTKSGECTFNKEYLPYDEKQLKRFAKVDEHGRRYKPITQTRRVYLDEAKGVPVTDVWSDVTGFQTIVNSKERTGYPTQKPLALLERIIKASSNEGDVVLDPFCGCATTCVAAERLNRRWIGVDISVKAYDLIRSRLENEVPTMEKILWDKEINFFTYPPKRTDQGLPENIDQGYIYVISHPILTPHYVEGKMTYKVGIAKNFERRLASYQTGSPGRAYAEEYKALTPKYKEIERAIFDRFEGDRENEWVTASKMDIIAAIQELL